ncbi:MAG: RsmD family RNA methyltransferase [Pirellulaceae bacterium]|jgi:16S rRNA (guanine966-N2)-methyltransferase|nr:RsmD family RNA methyltransferase [Pirellulaceae bacterium]MDP7016719.1 RsmD family RNA methyltransferase [Pirellulaceae bacterium]
MPKKRKRERQAGAANSPTELRVIGGKLRGSRLAYHGDPNTRPMKDRVREAVFNLVGPRIEGLHAIDLFAGTGAIVIEAISRGAASGTAFEQHFPTAALIETNARALGLDDRLEIVRGDTFYWVDQVEFPRDRPWVVFFSPPYAFYLSRQVEMCELISRFQSTAPVGSALVVESDTEFSPDALPAGDWDVREYPPAQVALLLLAATDTDLSASDGQ